MNSLVRGTLLPATASEMYAEFFFLLLFTHRARCVYQAAYLFYKEEGDEFSVVCTNNNEAEIWTYQPFGGEANPEPFLSASNGSHVFFTKESRYSYEDSIHMLTFYNVSVSMSGTYTCCKVDNKCEIYDVVIHDRETVPENKKIYTIEANTDSRVVLRIPSVTGMDTQWISEIDSCGFEFSKKNYEPCVMAVSETVYAYCVYDFCNLNGLDTSINNNLIIARTFTNAPGYGQFTFNVSVTDEPECATQAVGLWTLMLSTSIIVMLMIIDLVVIIYRVIKKDA